MVLTDDAGIRRINETHRGQPEVTDVISFRYDPIPGAEDAPGAEIIVNAQRACETGRGGRHPWSADDEIALYIAHACDHLAGGEDADEKGRRSMRRRELRWLRGARSAGLVRGVITAGPG